MGIGLIGTDAIMSLWDNVSTRTNWFDLSGNITILGLSGTEAKVFLWCYVRAKIKRWWHGFSGR